MRGMKDSGTRIIDHWQSQELTLRQGNSRDRIATFESKYNIQFPSDVDEYFGRVDGMDARELDKDGFRFLSLDDVRPLRDEFDERVFDGLANVDQYFIFADCYAWSWAYAIFLPHTSQTRNSVVVVGISRVPCVVAESFSEFLDLYLDSSTKLTPIANST